MVAMLQVGGTTFISSKTSVIMLMYFSTNLLYVYLYLHVYWETKLAIKKG